MDQLFESSFANLELVQRVSSAVWIWHRCSGVANDSATLGAERSPVGLGVGDLSFPLRLVVGLRVARNHVRILFRLTFLFNRSMGRTDG